jgi:hypothetical protein
LTGTAGLNVLLHGDGGQSFFDFPNQAVQNNLIGVVVPAPNKNLFWGGGSGLQRTDGVAHAAAVNSLIQTQLPKDVAFDTGNVFFTGYLADHSFCLDSSFQLSERNTRRAWYSTVVL